jgi:hypothetical protein
MSKHNVVELPGRETRDELTELIRDGARTLIGEPFTFHDIKANGVSDFEGERH